MDGPGACRIPACPSIQTFLTTFRVTLRGNRLHLFFLDVFSVLQFPLKMSIFWLPKGPKNPSQTGFWAKSWFPKSIFYAFFGRSCIFYVFYLFCDHFSMIFRCFFRCIFRRLRLFFSNRRTFKVIAMDSVLSTFHVFHFSVFLRFFVGKIDQKWNLGKTSKNKPSRPPKWSQKRSEFMPQIQKIRKIASKI